MQYSGGNICSSCGKQLNPPYDKIYRHGKTILCEVCESEKSSRKKSSCSATSDCQKDKEVLFKTIRELFDINQVPEWWVSQIDKFHKEGKSYLALDYTIKYAILYEGFVPQEEYGISGIITMFYDKASKNYNQETKMRELNAKTEISNNTTIVRIKPPKISTWRPTSNIEDL